MKPFDYIYYRLLIFYQNRKDNVPEFSACMIITMLEWTILLILLILLELITRLNFRNYLNPYFLLAGVLLFVLNYYRYAKKKRIENLIQIWEKESEREKKHKKRIAWSFSISVFLAFIFLATLKNSIKLAAAILDSIF